ncbi:MULTISPECIES: glycosyltransferase 87 family protein [unclassified Kitasatospora]|uniref:glycosyltransferase 87 family protein n=1 Tax=unclassified Kitasatospora TaxID=2633591 RepID=UPI00247533A9|nr:glycosyltransferase 87 family protein [Kitasatospora sp. MAP12-44]
MLAQDGPAGQAGSSSGGLAVVEPEAQGATALAPAAPAAARGALWALGASWAATRLLILLLVFGVIRISQLDVTTDVSVIYHGWFEVLQTGTFPMDDVTWQYPPGAALVMLLPGMLPWSYLTSFFVLCGVFDAVAMTMLVRNGSRKGRSLLGGWIWVLGVPLLGPTVYCRYDILVTAIAIAGLLVLLRRPVLGGILLGLGGLIKLWPLIALAGTPRGRRTRHSWTAAAATLATLAFLLAAGMNGAFQFLTFQADRGIEVESLGALPLHFARLAGAWHGQVMMNYGSVEMLGPWVPVISKVAVMATLVGFGWLLLWRIRARRWQPSTTFDAALAALLIFTVTSRVISPQYMVWLVGLAAVCLTVRGTSQKPVALLILLATGLTTAEFPLMFGQVVNSLPWGVTVLASRNLLLLAATLISCYRLWQSTKGVAPAPQATTAVLTEPEQNYPVRPGIAYEQSLLDDVQQRP